ncbi:nitrate reductase molybdenum cofactor assembly chaperone [Virgibacillus kimchii]
MKLHQKVYKIAALLLQYPQKEWVDELPELKAEIQKLENPMAKAFLSSFIHYLECTPYIRICENYVNTFDYHGVTSLYLTYNVFKDSRDRGEALVKLRRIMNDSDLELESEELPDYLPMILEFLSEAEEKYIQRMLKLHLNSMVKVSKDLAENDSPYHFLLKAVIEVSRQLLKNEKVS